MPGLAPGGRRQMLLTQPGGAFDSQRISFADGGVLPGRWLWMNLLLICVGLVPLVLSPCCRINPARTVALPSQWHSRFWRKAAPPELGLASGRGCLPSLQSSADCRQACQAQGPPGGEENQGLEQQQHQS